MDLSKGWNKYLRQQNWRCPVCKDKPPLFQNENALRKHLCAKHPAEVGNDEAEESQLNALVERARPGKPIQQNPPAAAVASDGESPTSPGGNGGHLGSLLNRINVRQPDDAEPTYPNKKPRTPTNSDHGNDGATTTMDHRRSRTRSNPALQSQSGETNFPRRPQGPAKHALWLEGQPGLSRKAANPALIASPRGKAGASFNKFNNPASSRHSHSHSHDEEASQSSLLPPQASEFLPQPSTQPISPEQLVAEVKGIYAGLVMVESKCIEVDTTQSAQGDLQPRLTNDQWQALIALHRTLLHEHHDFFLASQHPSASPALRRLATKYAMPARMWRHGIHSFLELLRRRLPESLEHMLTFIYLAYAMMALLYETVPAFEDTWIECLGDLGRYRMAIEDENMSDREVWTGVSRHWYAKASDKAPTTGRLYHHLAILARPNAVQQLYFYSKSLCVAIPFPSARESILTLFDPILNGVSRGLSATDLSLVRAMGILFKRQQMDKFPETMDAYVSTLDNWIHRQTKRWMEPGSFYALSLSCALLEFSYDEGTLMKAVKLAESGTPAGTIMPAESLTAEFINALAITTQTDEITLKRFGDNNVLPYIHCRLVFMLNIADYGPALDQLKEHFPWKLLMLLLNYLMGSYATYERVESSDFPLPEKGEVRPFPEDWALRGFPFSEKMYPPEFFKSEKYDDAEKLFELASMTEERKERILWLGYGLTTRASCLAYDPKAHEFSVAPEYDVDIEPELDLSPLPSPATEEDLVLPDAGEVPSFVAVSQ